MDKRFVLVLILYGRAMASCHLGGNLLFKTELLWGPDDKEQS